MGHLEYDIGGNGFGYPALIVPQGLRRNAEQFRRAFSAAQCGQINSRFFSVVKIHVFLFSARVVPHVGAPYSFFISQSKEITRVILSYILAAVNLSRCAKAVLSALSCSRTCILVRIPLFICSVRISLLLTAFSRLYINSPSDFSGGAESID
jgi:hypothetical protein